MSQLSKFHSRLVEAKGLPDVQFHVINHDIPTKELGSQWLDRSKIMIFEAGEFLSVGHMNINSTQVKCLSVFAIFAIIGFGPISPGCLIGLYITLVRPAWFLSLVESMYNHRQSFPFVTARQTRVARIKSALSLLTLFIIDIAPVPVTPVIAFVIILSKPQWFYRVVRTIYGNAV